MEYSYPIIEQPMSQDQWSSVTRGIGNGVLDDGGSPYLLTFPSDANATNTAILKCPSVEGRSFGHAILEGFYHRYDEDIEVTIPAVTESTLWHVLLEYSPARASEGGLPVQLAVLKGPLSYDQNRNYLHLYTIRRTPNQLLTDATVRNLRPRVAPSMMVENENDLPLPYKTLAGTFAVIHNEKTTGIPVFKMAMPAPDGGSINDWYWKTLYDPAADDQTFTWQTYADSATYASPGAGGTYQRAVGRRGKKRRLRGTVKRASGAYFLAGGVGGGGSDGYNVVNVSGEGPSRTQVFVVSTSGTSPPGYARLSLGTDGSVYVYPSTNCAWVSVDGVEWEVP